MEIKLVATHLNEMFPDCLEHFSTQKVKYLLNGLDMFLLKPNGSAASNEISVNYKHPLFTAHPENVFALKPLAVTFLEYCVPLLIHLPDDTSSEEVARLLSNSVEAMYDELYRRLSILTFGLDIDFITSLSGEMYESAAATDFQLAILPNESALQGIEFVSATRWELKKVNLHAVRKQLNMAKDGALAVIRPLVDRHPITLGLIDSREAERFPRFRFVGHMEWEFHMPSFGKKTCRMRYCQGHLMLPTNILKDEIYSKIEKFFPCADQVKTVQRVIVQLLEQNKGAAAVFSGPSTITGEVERLVRDLKRGIMPSVPIPVTDCPESLKRITSIDGAVMIDTNGKCYAFGVILDGECNALSKGDMARGARLNCAKAYIEWQRSRDPSSSWLGVVISEDGMFDLL